MKTINAIIERCTDGRYSVCSEYNKDLNFVVDGVGNTIEEAKEDFIANYKGMKEATASLGDTIADVDFVYRYDTASFLSYLSKAFSLAGVSRITGISQGQLSHYLTGRRNPSEATKHKIQQGIKAFAKDLDRATIAFA